MAEGGLHQRGEPAGDEDDDEEEKKRAFKEMRKKHYNEAEEIKRWKAEHADDSDDDDGDEDEATEDETTIE